MIILFNLAFDLNLYLFLLGSDKAQKKLQNHSVAKYQPYTERKSFMTQKQKPHMQFIFPIHF